MEKPIKLNQAEIEAVERTLSNGDRVEIVPTKDGVKVLRVRRDEVKQVNKGV